MHGGAPSGGAPHGGAPGMHGGAPSGGAPHGGAPGQHGGSPSGGAPSSSDAAPHGGKHDHEYYVSHDPFALDHSSPSIYMEAETAGFIEPTDDDRNMNQYGSATMHKRIQPVARAPPSQGYGAPGS